MQYQDIRVDIDGSVATVWLMREAVLNAYTPDMGEELVHAYRALAANTGIHAIILTGSGRAFCAGADRSALAGAPGRSGLRLGEEHFITGFAAEIAAMPCLTIAAINGSAAGIGITGTLAMDLRVAAEDAKLVLNFAELGIMPGLGSTHFLPRLLGPARARELLLCTRRVSGPEAAAMGLVNRAVPAEAVLEVARGWAQSVAALPRELIATFREGLATGGDATLQEALAAEAVLGQRLAVLRNGGVTPR
jgi:2-(1,2-epoxy-1,2-dihydrophenyl)acetyl-CoA isomerase